MFKKTFTPIFFIASTIIYFFAFPYLLILKFKNPPLDTLIVFGASLIILACRYNSTQIKRRTSVLNIEDLKEEMNLINSSFAKLIRSNEGSKINISRYNTLEGFVKELNKIINLDSLVYFIAKKTFDLFEEPNICLLYLLDSKKQQLELFSSYKKDPCLVIKAKQGDVVDKWVFRHLNPILIENIKKDFRFDLGKIVLKEHLRDFTSAISVPLVSEGRLIGAIRLDSLKPGAYNSDDLRFLNILAGISALAISNALLYRRTEELAITDSLTSLFTRKHLMERLSQELSRSARQKSELSILMLDIDDFKIYNDKFGHTAGDIVLKKISKLLINLTPEHEAVVSRFGGEEFAIALPGLNKKKSTRLAEGIRKEIEGESIVLRRKETNITISIGVSCYPKDGIEAQELIKNADLALLRAKRQGKNTVCTA